MNKKKKKLSYAKYGYIFSLPFVIAFLIFTLYPIIYTVIIGFTDLKGIGNTKLYGDYRSTYFCGGFEEYIQAVDMQLHTTDSACPSACSTFYKYKT